MGLRDRGLPSYEKEPRRFWLTLFARIGLFRSSWSRRDSLAVLIVLAAGYCGVAGIGPAWSAMMGHGTRGTFTVQQCTGGKRTCDWVGTFRADNGQDLQVAVQLGDGSHITHIGQQVPAIDTGEPGEVFPAGGGTDWLLFLSGLILLPFAVAFYIARAFFAFGGRRRRG